MSIRAFSSEHLTEIKFSGKKRYATLVISTIQDVQNYYGLDLLIKKFNLNFKIHERYKTFSNPDIEQHQLDKYQLKKLNEMPTQRVLMIDPSTNKINFVCCDVYLSDIYKYSHDVISIMS